MDGLDSHFMMGQLAPLYELLTKGPLALNPVENETFRALTDEWNDMFAQHDAGDFLGYLMQKALAEGFQCTNMSIFEHDIQRRTPVFLPFPTVQRPTNLQELIDKWSNHRAVIMQAEEVIVLRLGRYFQTVEGWLKHHGSIHWETPIRIPTGWSVGEDTTYEVMAAVVHHGEEHEAGHYTAYLFHEGQAWHVDDLSKLENNALEPS